MSAAATASSISAWRAGSITSQTSRRTSRSGRRSLQPALGEIGLALADRGEGKQMALDIVGFVDVRLDERDARDAGVAAEHVQHRHAAAARADLDEMGHTVAPPFVAPRAPLSGRG